MEEEKKSFGEKFMDKTIRLNMPSHLMRFKQRLDHLCSSTEYQKQKIQTYLSFIGLKKVLKLDNLEIRDTNAYYECHNKVN